MDFSFQNIFFSNSSDPYENLALENHLLLGLAPGEKKLFVYVNKPAIVMGRFQNPWIESNLSKLILSGVELVRRQSGGGCVYHDKGNLNFCFLHGSRDYFKKQNNDFMIKLLKDFDIPAVVNERSDIVLNIDKEIFKFSGSAFKQKKDRSFHHCTMLINSNLKLLSEILDSPLKNLKTKSTASNRVPVKNLFDINEEISIHRIIQNLQKYTNSYSEISYAGEELLYLEKLKSWNWIFGETPLFECELVLSVGSISLKIRKGIIIVATSLSNELSSLCVALIDLSLSSDQAISKVLSSVEYGEDAIQKLKELDLVGHTGTAST